MNNGTQKTGYLKALKVNPSAPMAPNCYGTGTKKLNGEENHSEDVDHAEPYMDTGDRWDPNVCTYL